MKFQTIPVQIAGPSYQSTSRPLSSQRTVNWYPQLLKLAKDEFVLKPFPGLKLAFSGSGEDRGIHSMGEYLYQVRGSRLIKFNDLGESDVGEVLGSGRCIMADDGVNLFIVDNGSVFWYDGLTVKAVTDSNIVGAISVDFINNQFLYTKPDFTTVSNVGDGSTANGLNMIGEETDPDNMVRDFVFDEIIYRFGKQSTVAWYNSGVGNPPIEKLQGRIFQVGLAAIHSVARTDEAMYWLGDDYRVYMSAAGTKQAISSEPLSNQLALYAAQSSVNISDAIGSTITLDGNNFYILKLPTNNRTFAFNESLGALGWFELSSGLDGDKYQGNSYEQIGGKTYVADELNGNMYTLDASTFTNNSQPLRRERITGSVNGKTVSADGNEVQMSKIKIIMETGVGLIAGQGDNPRIMVEHSDDGGRTWSHGSWPTVGRLGEFTLQVEYFNLDWFYDRMFRISTTDPVNYTIHSATITLRANGR